MGNTRSTPLETASTIAERIWPDIVATYRRRNRPVRILEPGAGEGNLIAPLLALSKRDNVPLKITAVEIDRLTIKQMKARFKCAI